MSEILSNTGVKLWSETDYNELWLTVFDQLTGQGGKSNIRLIDEAIGKINTTLDGYKFEFSSDEDRLYISKGDLKLPVSLIDSNGHVASKVDGTTITIDESGVVKGVPVDDALSEESTNPLQNKVIAGELKSIKSKMGTDESAIKQNTSDITSNTKRIEANETAISTLNGTGDGSVKKAVSDEIAKVVAGAPEDFDTLKEMSDWISTHETSASAMNSQIQDNKSAITILQTNKADKTEIPTVPTNVSEFTNDAGYLTEHQDISNLVVKEEGKGLSSNDYTSEEKTKLGDIGTSQGRNLIPYPLTDRTTNGITYTVQSDGSVLANGTASAENNAYYNFAYKTLKLGDTSYTLSCEGLPKSVYVYVYDETIGKAVANVSDTPVTKTFVGDSTHTYSLSINVGKGTSVSDLAIKPILEMGTTAHAYEPILESNVNLKDAIDKVPTSQGRNLISYPYYNGASYELNGITYTVNETDGTITVNGTATNNSFFNLTNYIVGKWGTLHAGTYTIMDGVNLPIGGVTLQVESTTGTQYKNKTFTIEQDVAYKIFIYIPNGTVANNITFKPMLEIGSIAHMYEPTTISNTTLGKKLNSFKQYKPDGTTITADEDGTLHGADTIKVDGITITRDDATKVIALAKTLQDKIGTIDNKVDQNYVVNNLTTTEQGFVLDGRQGKALQDQITSLNGSLNSKFQIINPDGITKNFYYEKSIGNAGGWFRFFKITYFSETGAQGAAYNHFNVTISQVFNNGLGGNCNFDIIEEYADKPYIIQRYNTLKQIKKFRIVRSGNIIYFDFYANSINNTTIVLINIPFYKNTSNISEASIVKYLIVPDASDGEKIIKNTNLTTNN